MQQREEKLRAQGYEGSLSSQNRIEYQRGERIPEKEFWSLVDGAPLCIHLGTTNQCMYMKKWPRPGKEPSERIRVKIAWLSPGWKLFLPTKLGKLVTHRVGVEYSEVLPIGE